MTTFWHRRKVMLSPPDKPKNHKSVWSETNTHTHKAMDDGCKQVRVVVVLADTNGGRELTTTTSNDKKRLQSKAE